MAFGWLKKAVTEYNPVAGTINAGAALAKGDFKGAGKAFANGMTYGTLAPGVDAAGNVVDAAANLGKEAFGSTDTKPLDDAAKKAGSVADDLRFRAAWGDNYQPPQVNDPGAVPYNDNTQVQQTAVHLDPSAPQVTAPDLGTAAQATAAGVAAPNIDDGAGQADRGMQMGLVQQLQDAAAGRGPSVADADFARRSQDTQNQAMGLAASARGNQGAALRLAAMRQNADAGQRQNLDSALLKAQEMTSARGALGGALSDVRGTDTSLAVTRAAQGLQAGTTNATLATGTSQFDTGQTNDRGNLAGQLKLKAAEGNADRTQSRDVTGAQLGLTSDTGNANRVLSHGEHVADQTQAAAEHGADRSVNVGTTNQGAGLTAHGQGITRDLGLTNAGNTAMATGAGLTEAQIKARQADKDRAAGMINGAVGGMQKGAITLSDRGAKRDISDVPTGSEERLAHALKLKTYAYKDDPEGEKRVGVIAQDLQKAGPIGKALVHEGPDGQLGVDYQGLALALAAQALRSKKAGRAA